MASDLDNESASPRQRSTTPSRGWLIGKYVISLLLVAYLAVSVDWPKVWASARAVSVPWLLISLFYIPASIIIVALRYRDLIDRLISLKAMLHVVVLQGAVSTFLANAAGSLSYIGILIRIYKVPAELAVQSTLIARLVEMLASLVLAAALVALAWTRLERIQSLVLLAMTLAAIGLFFAAVLIAVVTRSKIPTAADSSARQRLVPSFVKKMLDFGVRVVRLNPRYVASILPRAILYSVGSQVVIAVAMYCNARAFHLEVGFFEAALVGIVSSFIASVPVTVLGGLGVYEVSTVGLLAVFGVPVEAGAAMILVVRTIFFLVMALAFFVVRPPSD